MTDLPKIYNPNEIVVPAQDKKSYPDGWCREFYVYPPDSEGKQALVAMFRPYNKATGEMYQFEDKDYKITIDNIFAEVERVPLFAQAMGYIITSLSLGVHELVVLEKLKSDPNNAIWLNELASVRSAMGIV
jgi:hypothetical protein